MKITRSRIAEPSSWGGIGGIAMLFAVSPQSVLLELGDVVIPWQLRLTAFAVAIACFIAQLVMREWPNK